jgi:long-chain acyl-CoA synthetase
MLGHNEDTRAAIFADTRAEWLIAFQVSSCLQCLYVSFSFYP